MKKIKSELLRKAKQEYDDVIDMLYEKEEEYNQACIRAQCCFCSRWEVGKVTHDNCKDNFVCDEVVESYREMNKFHLVVDKEEKKYAKVIFELLSKEKPKLVSRITKKVLDWDEVFPSKFSEVSSALRDALIELIQSDGSLYLFYKTKVVL